MFITHQVDRLLRAIFLCIALPGPVWGPQYSRTILSSSISSLLLLPLWKSRDNKNHLTGGWAAQARQWDGTETFAETPRAVQITAAGSVSCAV